MGYIENPFSIGGLNDKQKRDIANVEFGFKPEEKAAFRYKIKVHEKSLNIYL